MSDPIVVDSSVLIGILNREPETPMFLEALDRGGVIVGWPTIFESRIWTLRRNDRGHSQWLDHWLRGRTVLTVPFDGELERLAAAAFDRFGKGRHRAALNFGDCMAYAVARHHDAPLLFKGSDFGKTDLKVHEASVVTA